MFELITGLATLLSLIGAVLIARKNIKGFYLWIFSNGIWVGVDIYKGIYFQAVLFLFYFATCLYGIKKWRKG